MQVLHCKPLSLHFFISQLLEVQFLKSLFVALSKCEHYKTNYYVVKKKTGKHSGRVADFFTYLLRL